MAVSRGSVTAKEKAKRLKGRTIVKAEPRAFLDAASGRGRWCHDWRLTLDDGTTVIFVTEETETGEYGTDLILT